MKEHENTELYRSLRGAFEMTPEQKHRVAEKIRRRAAAGQKADVPAVQDAPAEKAAASSRPFGGYWFAVRVIPLAACLVLVCAGAFFLHRGFADPADSVIRQDSLSVAEQTAMPVTDTTAPDETAVTQRSTEIRTAVQSAAEQQSTASASESRTTAAQIQTAGTETAAETAAPVTEVPETAETTKKETTEETTKTETTEKTTTTAEAETEPPQTADPENVHIVIPDITAEPGQTVTLQVRAARKLIAAGIQFYLRPVTASGVPVPTFSAEIADAFADILADAGTYPLINYSEYDNSVAFVAATGVEFTVPGDTVLLEITVTVPQEMQAGQTISFQSPDRSVISDIESNAETLEFHFGSITVI